MDDNFTFQIRSGDRVSESDLESAARLFSDAYGTWGWQASSRIDQRLKQGTRIKMGARKLRAQCIPGDLKGRVAHVRVLANDELIGSAWALYWVYDGLVNDKETPGKCPANKVVMWHW